MIIGEFNVNKTKNKQLSNFSRNNQFMKITTAPTFLMADTTPDIISHTSKIKNNFIKIELVPDSGSNHLIILIKFDTA